MNLERLQIDAAVTAMNKMLKGSHFSICTVDNVAKMLGIHCRKDSYDILRNLHCVDFTDMTREMRQAVPALIADTLGEPPAFQFNQPSNAIVTVINVEIVDVEFTEVKEAPKTGFRLRLPWSK